MIIKNSNVRRGLFDNRYLILGIIIAIILILMVIRILNNWAKEKNITPNITNQITQAPSYTPEKTIIAGEEVNKNKQKENLNVIDNFINYCNTKKIQEAYNLLSKECKETVFSNEQENFEENYVNRIFETNKIYNMQSWVNSTSKTTYRMEIMDDILATGQKGNTYEDYYTILEEDGEYKLNINNYIGRDNINKQQTANGITIELIYKDIYKEYETYYIKVQNNSQNTILVDSKEQEKTVYEVTDEGAKYSGYTYELSDTSLEIKPQLYKRMKIRFNKMYSTVATIEQVVFSDIIENAEEYKMMQNKEDYKDRLSIKVEI